MENALLPSLPPYGAHTHRGSPYERRSRTTDLVDRTSRSTPSRQQTTLDEQFSGQVDLVAERKSMSHTTAERHDQLSCQHDVDRP